MADASRSAGASVSSTSSTPDPFTWIRAESAAPVVASATT